MLNKFDMIKMGISAVATSCVGMVVKEAIKKITPENLSRLQKIGMAIGGVIITDYASTKIIKYVDDQVTVVENAIELVKEATTYEPIEIEPIEVNETEEEQK